MILSSRLVMRGWDGDAYYKELCPPPQTSE